MPTGVSATLISGWASYLLVGGFVGGLGGVQVIKILKAMGNADFVIKMTYVVMLGIVGSYMLIESINAIRKAKKKACG